MNHGCITFRTNSDNQLFFDVVLKDCRMTIVFPEATAGSISNFEAVSKGFGAIEFCGSDFIRVFDGWYGNVSFGVGGDKGQLHLNLPFQLCKKALAESFEARRLMIDHEIDWDEMNRID